MTRRLLPLTTILLAMIVALWVGWIGFIASDDSLYYVGAQRWATEPPFPGSDHWTTRLPLMWLFAALLRLVGENFTAFAATAIVPYAALVALGWAAGREGGRADAGWLAALLVATMPVVVSHASTVSVDLLEAVLLLGGALLLARGDRAWQAVAAGICFGLAIVCRETALLALVGLAPLFLLGRPVVRHHLLLAGLGIGLVLLGEAAFQWSLTGDPLRRYTIAFHHDERVDRAANLEGNLLLHPAIDPLLVLLINDDFGLLFWLAIAAAGSGAWRRGASPTLLVLGAMALAAFVLVAVLATKLVLNPRYFMLPALAAAVLVARWLATLPPFPRWSLILVTVASNLLLMGVGNAHPRWGVETLVIAAGQHRGEPVHADAVDVRRAAIPLAFAALTNARAGPAPAGALLLTSDAAPGTVIAHYPSPPTRIGGIVRALGLEPLVPEPIRRRLLAPSPATRLIRTPG